MPVFRVQNEPYPAYSQNAQLNSKDYFVQQKYGFIYWLLIFLIYFNLNRYYLSSPNQV